MRSSSQWNPCRSRGARKKKMMMTSGNKCLSGTPAEAGVREGHGRSSQRSGGSLSGTPAEAGVRGTLYCLYVRVNKRVSVEPLPKQGCETCGIVAPRACATSQWNPCRSRGARVAGNVLFTSHGIVSVEPLPKQGCEPENGSANIGIRKVSVEPLPKQGCEDGGNVNYEWIKGLSGTPAEAGVRDFGYWRCYTHTMSLIGTPAEAGVRVGDLG